MALSAARLSTPIKNALVAAGAIDGAATAALALAIATAVVNEITANAVVTPGLTLIAPGGLSPLPCTGTGTVV